MMFWIKKLRKNKVVTLIVCVIVVSLVYIGAQKAIDNYNFKYNNDDVVASEDGALDKYGENEGRSSDEFDNMVEGDSDGNLEELEDSSDGEIASEETDLVLEEVSENLRTERIRGQALVMKFRFKVKYMCILLVKLILLE